jgi:hypothetical protein
MKRPTVNEQPRGNGTTHGQHGLAMLIFNSRNRPRPSVVEEKEGHP